MSVDLVFVDVRYDFCGVDKDFGVIVKDSDEVLLCLDDVLCVEMNLG